MGDNDYYENVLRVFAAIDKNEIKGFVLDKQKWYEIDDAQDKDIAEVLFAEDSQQELKLMQKRYGGYWRFPKLIDFCYLVNPYFPTQRMTDEIKEDFMPLLAQYPSGLSIQNLLAAKLFDLDEDCVLVGNGAAELISALSIGLSCDSNKKKFGVIYPTFNEYFERFGKNCEIVKFFPKDSPQNFSYGLDDLLEFSQKCDTLLLINPDNPSGNYVKYDDIIKLLEKMKLENKTLVLDESFIDFCGLEFSVTFLKQDILNKYDNLIVIKSLSKSYGIPGIRLGVLANSDKKLINSVRQNLSIWNINSFAEYFLQIIGKYTKDYKIACQKIIAERQRFVTLLKETDFFEIYPSQANYLCCKIKAKNITSADLAKYLLEKHRIFIKDLTGKNGFENPVFVRLAVRNEQDNNLLISALKEFISEKK
jgi:histidinol-phosphate/aromatic aminotransferase/cobyric acid decarboxylase-like protein